MTRAWPWRMRSLVVRAMLYINSLQLQGRSQEPAGSAKLDLYAFNFIARNGRSTNIQNANILESLLRKKQIAPPIFQPFRSNPSVLIERTGPIGIDFRFKQVCIKCGRPKGQLGIYR